MPLVYNVSDQSGRRLDADSQDDLCAQFTDCPSCTLVQTFQNKAVRCQWVVGTNGPSCIGRPSGSGTSELSTWLSRYERQAISETGHKPVPKCRIIIRDSSKCSTAGSSSSILAKQCSERSSPRCHTCGLFMEDCGFCGETSVDAAAATGRAVTTRCVGRFGAAAIPCTVACKDQEEVFRITTASVNGGMVLRGRVEYPLWRDYGMQYATGQPSCTWRLGEIPLGPMKSVLNQELERGDSVWIKDADREAGGQLPLIFDKESDARSELELRASVTLQFNSDDTREASGFKFEWDQDPPPGNDTIASTTLPSSGQGGGGTGNTGGGGGTAVDTSVRSDGGGGQPNLVIILVGVVGGFFLLLLGCFCFLYAQRLTCWLGAGSSVPTASTPKSSREERERQRRRREQREAEQEEEEDEEDRRRQAEYDQNKQRRREASNAGDRSSYRGKSKAKAAPPRPKASTASASSGKAGKQSATPKAPAAAPPPPPPTPPPPPPPKQPKKNKKSKTEQNVPPQPQQPDNAANPAVAVHTAAIHQEMIQAMDAPEAKRKIILRDLQRKWHPDKNKEEDKEVATAVFQYINSNSQWFLNKGGEATEP